jgi:hypothetical protein
MPVGYAARNASQLDSPDRLQTCVEIIVDRKTCRIHRFQDVGRVMGLEQLNPEHKVKHRTPKGLRQAILAFQQLPLETVVQGDDHLRIAASIHTVLDLLVSRFLVQCHTEGYQSSGSERKASSFESTSYNCNDRRDRSEFPSPSEYIGIDERHINAYIANYFLGHLHSRLFPPLPTDSDLNTQDRINRLHWLKPKHLDVPEALLEIKQVFDAMKLLRDLSTLRSPSEMLASLSAAFRRVGEAASLSSQLQPTHGDRAYGADDLVPLFILVVIKANPPMLSSVLVYSERLITETQRLTEQGYALTLLRSALDFVENVSPDKLTGLLPGEWERLMGIGMTGARRSHRDARDTAGSW